MSNPFFDHPILNSPYECPSRHWELDASGQPTQRIMESRRRAEFITPIPKPKKQKKSPKQEGFQRQNDDGTSTLENGRLPLFRNFDETTGNPLPRPNTLLIDSEQLEAGDALDDKFHDMAADEIEHFRREIVERTGDARNEGIIGEGVNLTVDHLGDVRASTLLFNLAQRLLYTKWRDPGEDPRLHLFGQLKRIVKEWLDSHLECKGGTYPAQLMYLQLADMACERITAAITRQFLGERPIKALLDPYNPTGSTRHVRFNTSKAARWETSSRHCHINWVVLDSDWEAEFCRVAEAHPQVRAYVKNHGLGFEVPYRYGSETRKYLPDFIVLVDDGHGPDDLLRLVVEIKGYRREDAKEKKSTMDTYWVPGVNHLGTYGRWAFAEFTDVFRMQEDFARKVEAAFANMLSQVGAAA